MARIWLLVTCLAVLAGPSAAQKPSPKKSQQQIAYYPAVTTLEGVLVREHRLGPPGFGETPKRDAKVTVIVVVLKKPVKAVPDEDAAKKNTSDLNVVSGVSKVQLFFEGEHAGDEAKANRLIGKKVTVEGAVSEAVAPMQFTPLTMSVTRLSLK